MERTTNKAAKAYDLLRSVTAMVETMELYIEALEGNENRSEAQDFLLKNLKNLHEFVE